MGIANQLTLARIIFAGIFYYLFTGKTSLSVLILCLVISLLIEFTDILDGHLARKNNAVSDFGKLFDPLADSLARLTIFFAFFSNGLIPLWILMIFVFRDVLISYLRSFASSKGIVLAALLSGKLKAIVQGTIINISVFVLILKQLNYLQNTGFLIQILFVIAAIVTAWSGIDYFIHVVKKTKLTLTL